MQTTSLAGNVQESKAQRQERLKSRFRDRGGIFVPSEGNPLVDILLARGVNGESPVKKRPRQKSVHTPKPRSSASKTKTPRTGTSKRAPSKSAFVPTAGDENYPPSIKKRRGTSRTPKLQVSKRANGMDAGTSAGLSPPHAAPHRKPFADQLADAIKYTKTQTVLDSCSPAMKKIEHAEPAALLGTAPEQGKLKRAPGKRKAKPVAAAVLTPRYSDEFEHSGEEHVSKPTKCPAFILLEMQGRDGQTKGQGSTAPEVEQVNDAGMRAMRPSLLHDQRRSSSDSSVPLAKKHAAAKSKRARPMAGTRRKPKTSNEDASQRPTKKRGRPRVKTLPIPAEDPHDKAMLQEKIAPAPAKVPRKRKQHVKASIDKDDNDNGDEREYENTHELPQKKRRRADLTTSRNAKENRDMSRSACEAAAATKMNKVRPPSPVEKPTRASPKPSSKTKARSRTAKPRSRAGASAKSGTRPRGLPPYVRRRVEVIAQNLLATDSDDDDPIDFLR